MPAPDLPRYGTDGGGNQLVPVSPMHGPAAFEACLRAIERVGEVIEQETSALRRNEALDLADFNRRKSHGLLELSRALRGIDSPAAKQAIEPFAVPLRKKLEANSAVLRRHLEAVQAVAGILSRAIRDGESDGTYSAAIRVPGGAR